MKRSTLGLAAITVLLSVGAADAETPGRLPEAIELQQKLIAARPGDAAALNDLGNLYDLAGETELAEEAYRQAIEIAPESSVVHYNLGLLLQRAGRSRQAEDALETVIKLDPDDAWGHYQLATLFEARRRKTKATRHYARAFLLAPELLELEHNPQLLDSRLVMRASMEAYLQRIAQLENAPRQYQQPDRITGLLVPESTHSGGTPSEPVVTPTETPETTPAPARRDPEPPRDVEGEAGAEAQVEASDDDSHAVQEGRRMSARERRARQNRRKQQKPPSGDQ